MATLKGIDISTWQGEVDFLKLKENEDVDFVIARSSYGNGFTDGQFVRNRNELRRLGIPHGYYHYAYPTFNKDPKKEAEWFAQMVGELEHGEILVLDFEESYPTPVEWCKGFLDKLSELFDGYKPMIYLDKHRVQSFDWSPVVKAGYGLWLAYWDYDLNTELLDLPYWKTIAMRQYTNKNSYDGVSSERVDANIFYGDLDTFYKYGIQLDEIKPVEIPPFNFDHTKRLSENAWVLLGYEKLEALGRSWALDTLGHQYEDLHNKYQEKLLECPESEQLQLQVAELLKKNKSLAGTNTTFKKANEGLTKDNIWLEQDKDSWKMKAEGNLEGYSISDLIVEILKRLKIK